jgi:hypothetical protein
MDLINPHAYSHIHPRTSVIGTQMWHCARCDTEEVFWIDQLNAGLGLTDLIKWATQHTAGDCDRTPPPRPHVPPVDTNGTPRPAFGGGNGGHIYDNTARCTNKGCGLLFEHVTKPCKGTPTP